MGFLAFQGTKAELIESGVACAAMFDFGRCGQKTARDEFGDRYQIRQRANGRYGLIRWFHEDVPNLGNCGRGKGWGTLGPGVCAEVEAAMQRMRARR